MDNNQLNLTGKWVDFRQGSASAAQSSLTTFPFVSHKELVRALNNDDISIPINTVAMYEAAKKISVLPWQIFVISNIFPVLAVIYISFLNNWWYVLSLLFIPVALGIFHPTTTKSIRPVGSILAAVAYVGFILGLFDNIVWAYLVCGIGIFYHLAWRISAAFSRNLSNQAICNDATLLTQLWQSKQIFIKFKDGRTFFPE